MFPMLGIFGGKISFGYILVIATLYTVMIFSYRCPRCKSPIFVNSLGYLFPSVEESVLAGIPVLGIFKRECERCELDLSEAKITEQKKSCP